MFKKPAKKQSDAIDVFKLIMLCNGGNEDSLLSQIEAKNHVSPYFVSEGQVDRRTDIWNYRVTSLQKHKIRNFGI